MPSFSVFFPVRFEEIRTEGLVLMLSKLSSLCKPTLLNLLFGVDSPWFSIAWELQNRGEFEVKEAHNGFQHLSSS